MSLWKRISRNYLRVTSGANEVQASVNPKVNLIVSLRLLLLSHINLMLVINEIDNGCPRVAVVHVVAEAWGINHGEFDFERLLLEFSLDDVDLWNDENK